MTGVLQRALEQQRRQQMTHGGLLGAADPYADRQAHRTPVGQLRQPRGLLTGFAPFGVDDRSRVFPAMPHNVQGLLGMVQQPVETAKYMREGARGVLNTINPNVAAYDQEYQPPTPELTADIASSIMLGPLAGPASAVSGIASGARRRAPRPTYRNMAEVPTLRGVDRDEAINMARAEAHLIPSGGRSGGAYLGGPRSIRSRKALNAMRKRLDERVAAGAGYADWYTRYRQDVERVTSTPQQRRMMAGQQAQYSAQASPEGEMASTSREISNLLAYGYPGKVRTPAQARASAAAAATGDPTDFQLGLKTGAYKGHLDPTLPRPPGATGTNDFRHFRNLGFTEADGSDQVAAGNPAMHKWADYETALAVDRANNAKLGGRTDWTGEEIQAAAWVTQKGDDLFDQRRTNYIAAAAVADPTLSGDALLAAAKKSAYDEAGKTIGDFFEKHITSATYEAQPYYAAGHLAKSAQADHAARAAFAGDPLSMWDLAPGNRDAIYDAFRHLGRYGGESGLAMRVAPTVDMQGIYMPPGGAALETNPGKVARPLTGFFNQDGKRMPLADRAILNAAEATRGYIDVQGASTWNKAWPGTTAKSHISLVAGRPGPAKAVPEAELMEMREYFAERGLPDVIDTGRGLTITSFDGPGGGMERLTQRLSKLTDGKIGAQQLDDLEAGKTTLKDLAALTKGKLTESKLKGILEGTISKAQLIEMSAYLEAKGYKGVSRARVDSGYKSYEGAWEAGMGSGEATARFLGYMDEAGPEVRAHLNASSDIPTVALARLERDDAWRSQWGATREDIQNARRIIGEGPGWIDRLEKALARGELLPAVGAAIILPQLLEDAPAEDLE